MAWRSPRFSYQHGLRDAGVSAVTSNNTVATDYPLARLLDERASVNMKMNASAADHYIQIDRGASTPTAIDRFYIPSGHNFAGADIRLRAATDAAITTSVDTLVATVAAAAGAIDKEFTSNTKRYVRLDWPNDSGQWEIPEIWLTNVVTTTRGPEPNWPDERKFNSISLPKANGEAPTVTLGASQRVFSFSYARTETADSASLDALIVAVGTAVPFILDPPYDDESAVVVRLSRAPRSLFDHPVPQLGVKSKRYTLDILEVLE